jgi:hypothetical protein
LRTRVSAISLKRLFSTAFERFVGMKRLKQLEEEKGKLKRIAANLALDKEMLRRSSSESYKAARRREVVGRVRATWRVSIRPFLPPPAAAQKRSAAH